MEQIHLENPKDIAETGEVPEPSVQVPLPVEMPDAPRPIELPEAAELPRAFDLDGYHPPITIEFAAVDADD